MPPSEHTHRCATCHAVYECDGEWIPAEQADGYLKAACYFYDLHQIQLCETCEQADKTDLPDSQLLARMMAHPHFGAIRRFKDDDWLVVFDETAQGRAWRGHSLAEAVEKWRDQYEAREGTA